MTAEPSPLSPYVGPRPFEERDADLFFGREGEVRELLSHVVANKVVLLYAASGAGKTSLLNAGVIPLLEQEERFEVLPIARLRRLDPAEASDAATGNVYVAATFLNWTSEADHGQPPQRLKSFLEALPRGEDRRGRHLPRAVFFDQFEELFTVYPDSGSSGESSSSSSSKRSTTTRTCTSYSLSARTTSPTWIRISPFSRP